MKRRPRDRYGRALRRGSTDELSQAQEPEQVVDSAAQACQRAIELFDERRFFEAHEFFEYVWKADDIEAGDRRFWQGVTQVAVGCCHAQRGNIGGARTLLERAAANLSHYPSPHQSIDTAALICLTDNIAQQIRRQGALPKLEFARFPPLTQESSLP